MTEQLNPSGINRSHLVRVSIIRLVSILGFFWIANRFFPDRSNLSIQGYVFYGGLTLLAVTAIASIILALRDRPRLAMNLSIATLSLVIISIGLAFNGLGVLLALILVLVVGSISAAEPQGSSWTTVTGSIVIGMILILMDSFFSAQPWRFDITTVAPNAVQYGWILAVFLFLANIAFFYRQFLSFPLRIKLAITFLVVTLASLWSLSFINNRTTEILLTNAAQDALFSTANQIRLSLDNFLADSLADVNNEARLPTFGNYLNTPATERANSQAERQAQSTLGALTARDPLIRSYSLVDLSGNVLLSSNSEQIGMNIFGETYFEGALDSSMGYVSEVQVFSFEDARLYFSAPVRQDVSTIGVLVLIYDAQKLQQIVQSADTEMGEGNFGVLFQEDLVHIAHSIEPGAIYKTVMPMTDIRFNQLKAARVLPDVPEDEVFLTLPELEANLKSGQATNEAFFFTATDVATGDRINQVVTVQLENKPWLLAFFEPEDVFLAPADSQLRTNSLISVIITLLVVLVGVRISQILTDPITSLTQTASEVQQGNLEARATVVNNDEIGELAQTFNNMAQQLSTLVTGLEAEVTSRTRELAIRSDRLQTAAEIARDVTIETDLDIMLQRAATLIADRLELYFAGIYLLDRSGDFSQLVAGSGDEGQLLVDSDHRASMGVATPLSYTMTTGEPRLIREDDATLNLIRHPVLPNLREQLVLPLKAGNDLIGAIDLQSETLHKFSEDDIPALSVLADQLAIAIQKNQLTSNMEQTLNELETAYGRYTRESWESFLAEKNITGYRFSQLSVEPTTSTDPEVREAWMTGEIVVLNDGQSGRMLVPMKVRGQVIGVLNLGYQGENLTQETRALVDEIATRLGLIMENARLVETAQRRVERERLVGEVTTRMRQTLDMDGVLRTSVEEIARTLGLPEMEIRLGNYMSKLGSNGNGHLKANSNSLAADANNGNTANGYDPLLDDDVDDSPPGNPQGLSE